ncbi:MAG: TMEM175 family protein [Candidatus Bathyarchaeia archaeon]|jgi:uncharacterized membrane protein
MSNEPTHEGAKVKMRIAPESFSDIIFGLALSIGSLVLIQNQIRTWNDFVGNIFVFGFSFLIIASTWVLFSRTISQLSTESNSVLLLNLALFFCVALEPYLFYLLWNNSPAIVSLLGATSATYALDVGFMFMILATLGLVVVRQNADGGKVPLRNLNTLRRDIVARYAVGLAFLLSAAPIFWIPTPIATQHLRSLIWYASFVSFFIAHGSGIREKIKHRKPAIKPQIEKKESPSSQKPQNS